MKNSQTKPENVFLSYAQKDRSIAAKLAEHLEAKGISVFWDTDIRNGTDWREKLEEKLNGVSCVLVLWSQHSVKSEWVLEEADYGKSRQILVSARLDESKLPIGHRRIHTDDLSNWRDAPPAGIVGILRRIDELLELGPTQQDRRSKDARLRINPQPAHTSISDHELDKAAVIKAIDDMPLAVDAVENGYGELQSAQEAAKSILNDRISSRFYASAAEHFGQALTIIKDARLRAARDGRTVGYFLSMERANALV
jgi:TIR domain